MKKSRLPLGWIVFAIIVLLAGGGIWYYFFGKKPRVVLTVALREEVGGGTGMWPVGKTDVLVLAGSEAKLVDFSTRAVKWSTKLPARQEVDAQWRNAINARFVRLQQWSEELGAKRTTLKTPKETAAFNEEAAKYQAELSAVRAASANPVLASAKKDQDDDVDEPAAPAAKAELSKPEVALKPVTTPEMQLLAERIKRRTAQMSALKASIQKKKTAAKTPIQLSVVADEERRLAGLAEEQKAEESQLATLSGKQSAPVVEQAPEKSEAEPAENSLPSFYVQEAEPFAALLGSDVWVADDERLVALDHASGKIKSDIALAGAIIKAWSKGPEMYVVAAAGEEARQITRITSAGPTSLFVPAGQVEGWIPQFGSPANKPQPQKWRTEFSGPLTRVDLRLQQANMTVRDAIKPGSDKELTDTISGSSAHSQDEAMAVLKLMENDGKRLSGNTHEFVDESTYEVTMRRPLDPSVPEWNGTITGRAELFSTQNYQLLVAGTKLLAFDMNNRKLWEATLGARLLRFMEGDEVESGEPCMEAGDRLYFADGAFLTAFEAASGKVLWRLPSIGIRKLVMDADGNLYVHSRNLPAEAISYAAGDHSDAIEPVLIKVDPATGKAEWQVDKFHDVWVSEKELYVLRESVNPAEIEEQVFGGSVPHARVKLYKLSRASGNPIWEWFQPRRPESVLADRRTVGLLFGGELQVLHSIAW